MLVFQRIISSFFTPSDTNWLFAFLVLQKLIKRTIFTEHTKLLVQRQEALLGELKRQAEEGFTKAEEEWEKSVIAWGEYKYISLIHHSIAHPTPIDQRQKRLKADTGRGEDSGSAGGPTRHPTEDPEAGLDEDNYPATAPSHPPVIGSAIPASTAPHSEKAGKPPGDKDAQPPAKKFRLTENMKAIVWELVLLSNECCRLENEKKWVLLQPDWYAEVTHLYHEALLKDQWCKSANKGFAKCCIRKLSVHSRLGGCPLGRFLEMVCVFLMPRFPAMAAKLIIFTSF